ncbi:MAG: serine/threonine protein kinase [Deltaproteobacteria bacterium]|nr:serine/threonine protein kinase [Deltaproteobacteria bacterium]
MSAPNQVRPGEVLAGRYLVERQLGVGGMGVVVAATHMQLDQKVALKFLLPEAMANQEAVQRFLREARAAVKLRSEHVARVSDVGTLESGAPYIVMEYLEGYDLSREVAQRGRLPAEEATEYVLQACIALAEAHNLGIVHRDIKPANMFLTRRADGTPLVKVLDFGISKAIAGNTDQQLTRTQSVMGSPNYMSPEQMRGTRNADHRSDIWSLGVVLYELLVGRVPWAAESFSAVCLKVAMEPLPAMDMQPGQLPAGLEDVVSRCLDKNMQTRFQSIAELAVALAPFTTNRGRDAVDSICRIYSLSPEAVAAAAGGAAVALPSRTGDTNPSGGVARPFDRTTLATASGQVQGRRKLVIGGGIALLAAGGVVALLLAGGGKKKDGGAGASPSLSPSPSAQLPALGPDAGLAGATPLGLPDAAVAGAATPDAALVAAAAPDAGAEVKKKKKKKNDDIFNSRK